jgi:hypothetical protein
LKAFVFASTISGRFANFVSMNPIVPSTGRRRSAAGQPYHRSCPQFQ